ncbi:hypothetical protein MPL3356_110423 [Mesorhizobium plurifarium]|uniref:Multi-ubiquitin domain-containing protein n=1 Tax=Mesorhizobium plurifarium TaxID=69974 RepID=A0A090DAS1_MESPL|nr:hypothetical protein MPL3356_110423 [Mesorhizobium plurifarium]
MNIQNIDREADNEKRFAYLVNAVSYRTLDRRIDGREILTTSNHLPADEHILIQVLVHGSQSIGLDEKVDLREEGTEVFRAFHADRIYTFTVEARGYQWGWPTIAEAELRGYAGLNQGQIFALDRTDAPDMLIRDGSEISFAENGSERLKIIQRPLVVVKVNTKPVQLPFGWHTGLDIKKAAIAQGVDIRVDFTLDEELPGGDSKVIGDTDPVFVSGCEAFGAVDHHEDS